MFAKACLLFVSGGLLVQAADQKPDAFLDRPLPHGVLPHVSDSIILKNSPGPLASDFAEYHSYEERLDVLEKLAPRPLLLPDGFLDFVKLVDRRSDWDKGDGILMNERCGLGMGTTYRSFFRGSFAQMGLNFDYDPKRDALVAYFAWRRNDPRSCRELLDILAATKRQPTDSVGFTLNKKPDAWSIAFDALLSKPENFPSSWKLRFLNDARGAIFAPVPGTILWAGYLPDEKNHPQFLIINYHQAMIIPGPPGSFGCYVFDGKGQFEYGAILDGGYRCAGDPKVVLNSSKRGLNIFYNEPVSGTLTLGREGVLLKDSDSYNGRLLGIPLYRTETILN